MSTAAAPAHLEKQFEAEIEAHLLANGWVQGDPASYDRELGLDMDQLVAFVQDTQPQAWEKLVKVHGSDAKARVKFGKRVAQELTARGVIAVLRSDVKDLGVAVKLAYFAPAHDLTPDLGVKYAANRVVVTRQAPISESNPLDTVDLLLTLNGIPVATAELKTQTTGQSVEHAMRQYRDARNPADLVFKSRTVVHFAVDQDMVNMTTRLAGKDTVFLPFNQGTGGPGADGGAGNPVNPNGHRTSYLWEKVWQRDAWLDILGSFIHVQQVRDGDGKKTGQTVTVFPRYHQWDAVTCLLAAARADGPGKNKLVQHSAGSGKSNTIAWLAHRLSRLHTPGDESLLGDGAKAAGLGTNVPVFDKVVIVTDRVVLDRQLQDTVSSFDHTPGMIQAIGDGKTSADLKEALEGKQARIIITTLQKFPVVAQTATELEGTRFAVLVDEAHSSQSGEAAKDLKAVLSGKTGDTALEAAARVEAEEEAMAGDSEDQLAALLEKSVAARGKQENLTFFAFTATPKHKTLSLFGELVEVPDGEERYVAFHLYSMRQAIEEKFILDVLASYTTYKTYYRLANGLSSDDPELPKGKAASALARFVSLHPTNLAQKAQVIVEHFRAHTRSKIGGRAKAMVVTRSRLHAVRYHQAITDYIKEKGYDQGDNPLRSLVAFSGTVIDPDNPNVTYRESLLNGFGEKELPKRFDTDDYQVLVVAEKYQTGFDQPLLHTMYVDKKLADVKAVQTLSRLNRIAPGKDDTFVLDFANDAEDIVAAFEPFYRQTVAAPTDPNILYTLQERINSAKIIHPGEMRAGVQAILAGGATGSAKLNAAIDPAVERWKALEDDNEREAFRTALRDFTRTYAFLAHIIPFADTSMEELYYYGKYLLTRLPRSEAGGGVDLDGAVVLTHLRTEKNTEQSLSLSGTEEPLQGAGDGQGKKVEEPKAPLSQLIDDLNTKYGANLTEADRLWFEQLEAAHKEDPEVRDAALGNDLNQFTAHLTQEKLLKVLLERQDDNAALLKVLLDNPAVFDRVHSVLVRSIYDGIRTSTS